MQLSPGDFKVPVAEQIYCCIDGDKVWAPWTLPADTNIDKRMEDRQKGKGCKLTEVLVKGTFEMHTHTRMGYTNIFAGFFYIYIIYLFIYFCKHNFSTSHT